MKKEILFIACLATLLVSLSAFTFRTSAPQRGYLAPEFNLTRGNEQFSSTDLRGQYTLLTFWSSADARSRVACNQYATASQELGLQFVGVNFDRNRDIFAEVVSHDNIDLKTQFFPQGESLRQLVDNYRLEDGLNTFLINPDGRIVATNPVPGQLEALLH